MNPTIVYICMTLAGGQEFRDTPCEPIAPTKPPLVGTINEWPPKVPQYAWRDDQIPSSEGSRVITKPRYRHRGHWGWRGRGR